MAEGGVDKSEGREDRIATYQKAYREAHREENRIYCAEWNRILRPLRMGL